MKGRRFARLFGRARHPLAVALVSLPVAGLGVGKWAPASVDGWADGMELVFGVAVIAIVTAGGLLARWLARRDGAAARAEAESFTAVTERRDKSPQM